MQNEVIDTDLLRFPNYKKNRLLVYNVYVFSLSSLLSILKYIEPRIDMPFPSARMFSLLIITLTLSLPSKYF